MWLVVVSVLVSSACGVQFKAYGELERGWKAPLPNATDYAAINIMMDEGRIPWPHGHRQHGGRKNLTPAQLRALGKKFFSSVPASQNSTVLATLLYTWTQPTYRLSNFPMTARPRNTTALGQLIVYMPVDQVPWTPQMFDLWGSTRTAVLDELTNKADTIWAQAESQNKLLEYTLSALPAATYKDTTSPKVLYRGGGRNTAFFCNQFSTDYGVSIDNCIARYFGDGNTLTVYPFWSTSSDISVTRHYNGGVLYYVIPSKKRTQWHARDINDFNINMSNDEFLYPRYSRFVVQSVTCIKKSFSSQWNVTLVEANPAAAGLPHTKRSPRTFEPCVD